MKGRWITYSDEELAFLEANHRTTRRALHAAFVARFGREDVSLANLHALCKRRGWLTGSDGRFAKGLVPHNKGKVYDVARRPASARHWFKRGEIRGAAERNYKPIGSERLTKDGYLERKLHDGWPAKTRWREVHLIEWEAINGPIPKGHALKCLDGNRRNTDPANWTAIPRAMLPRLGGRYGRGYDAAPAELKPTILAVAKLEHAAAKALEAIA